MIAPARTANPTATPIALAHIQSTPTTRITTNSAALVSAAEM
jgi:hypothetical protein